MTRKRPGALFAVVVLLVGLAGCRIAEQGDVIDDGPGPSDFAGLAQSATPAPGPRSPNADERAVVEGFLKAMVGGEEGQRESRLGVAKSFLTPQAAAGWAPSVELNVVRLTDDVLPIAYTDSGREVEVGMTQLGILQGDGTVDKPSLGLTSYTFNVVKVPGSNDNGYFIDKPPTDLLLTDTALKSFYAPTPLYFWNQQGSALVPDLRYLALTTAPETRATKLVGWLTNGPSRWLAKAVQALPSGTTALDGVTRDGNGAYVVNLSAAAKPVDGGPTRLHTQLAWTLRSLSTDPLKLRIASEEMPTPSGGLSARPDEDPSRYAVVAGAVHRVRSGSDYDGQRLPDVEALRSRVAAVAFANEEKAAAVIRHEVGGARLRLWIGPTDAIKDTGVTGRAMSQPIWLDRDHKNALLIIDGFLHQAGASGNVQRVDGPTATQGQIRSFSVAPDGRRIALILESGQLVTGVLQRPGPLTESRISVGSELRAIPTTLGNLQQVAFTQENRLAIAGDLNGKVSLAEITVDGAVVTQIAVEYAGSPKITRLVSYPDDPLNGNAQGPILFEINNVAYEAFPRSSPQPLDADDVIWPPAASPSASVVPSGSPAPPAPVTVTAPSFQG